MKAFKQIESSVLFLPFDNIDTDQIIPARFLKTTSKEGFGEKLFHDWRYHEDGSVNEDFAMNQEPGKSAQVLFAGDNFGCGSSREHAPWAIQQAGLDVVIAQSFADIFRNNSQKNGLLLIALNDDAHATLKAAILADPVQRMTVDLPVQQVRYGETTVNFEIDAFYKMCLLEGLDDFGYLLKYADDIRAYEKRTGK